MKHETQQWITKNYMEVRDAVVAQRKQALLINRAKLSPEFKDLVIKMKCAKLYAQSTWWVDIFNSIKEKV